MDADDHAVVGARGLLGTPGEAGAGVGDLGECGLGVGRLENGGEAEGGEDAQARGHGCSKKDSAVWMGGTGGSTN